MFAEDAGVGGYGGVCGYEGETGLVGDAYGAESGVLASRTRPDASGGNLSVSEDREEFEFWIRKEGLRKGLGEGVGVVLGGMEFIAVIGEGAGIE